MCNTDTCDDGRRSFIAGATGAVVGALVGNVFGQTTYPHNQPLDTRVLDNANVIHGAVTFKHGGKDSIDGYLARPKAEGRYPGVVVIAGNVITEEYIPN